MESTVSSAEPGTLVEAELLQRSRDGDAEAFAELFRGHYAYAMAVARRTTRASDPEDVVSEAFTKIWRAFHSGNGPSHNFKSYLGVTVRSVAVSFATKARDIPAGDAVAELAVTDFGLEDAADRLGDSHRIMRAFEALPSRWRSVLWMVEVQGLPMTQVAAKLNVSVNAASAIACRSRKGLRTAWLYSHLREDQSMPQECRWARKHLDAVSRARLSTPQRERLHNHVEDCGSCEAVSRKLAALASSLKAAAAIVGGGAGTVAALSAWANSGISRGFRFGARGTRMLVATGAMAVSLSVAYGALTVGSAWGGATNGAVVLAGAGVIPAATVEPVLPEVESDLPPKPTAVVAVVDEAAPAKVATQVQSHSRAQVLNLTPQPRVETTREPLVVEAAVTPEPTAPVPVQPELVPSVEPTSSIAPAVSETAVPVESVTLTQPAVPTEVAPEPSAPEPSAPGDLEPTIDVERDPSAEPEDERCRPRPVWKDCRPRK